MDLYTNLINRASSVEIFYAVATASSRSLLVWQSGDELHPFIAKVSLNKEIGAVNRSLKLEEVASSIGITQILQGSEGLPRNGIFWNEVLGIMPKGLEKGGMIIRPLLSEIAENLDVEYAPLFALYGKSDHIKNSLMLEMLNLLDIAPEEFIRNYIIRPFVKLWMELAINHGILTEPHAQNILIEIKNGLPTGKFVMRDFGGFNIDLKFRQEHGLFLPRDLPTASGDILKDYYQAAHVQNIITSLQGYFEGGFLFNVEKSIKEWSKAGLLKNPAKNEYKWTHDILMEELSEQLSLQLKRTIRITDYYKIYGRTAGSAIPIFKELVEEARAQRSNTLKCENIFL